MARLPRVTLPGYPHHIILRGNNRQAIFASEADYQTLLNLLLENAQKFKVANYAFALLQTQFNFK